MTTSRSCATSSSTTPPRCTAPAQQLPPAAGPAATPAEKHGPVAPQPCMQGSRGGAPLLAIQYCCAWPSMPEPCRAWGNVGSIKTLCPHPPPPAPRGKQVDEMPMSEWRTWGKGIGGKGVQGERGAGAGEQGAGRRGVAAKQRESPALGCSAGRSGALHGAVWWHALVPLISAPPAPLLPLCSRRRGRPHLSAPLHPSLEDA